MERRSRGIYADRVVCLRGGIILRKSTGVVRKLDELGRVVLPVELRRNLSLGEGDGLEIYVDGEEIILKKYQPGCVLCGGMEGVSQHVTGKLVCSKCLIS